jgi:3-(3-hydroxy-phenyl)propionate hydroxylase
LRDAVLSLSLTQEFVRPLYHWRTSRAHAYLDSPLNALEDDNGRFIGGVAVGEPMANVALGTGEFLMDYFPVGFLLLAVGRADSNALPNELENALADFRARGFAISRQRSHHPDVVARYAGPQGTGLYLFRPDQHVCARWLSADLEPCSASALTLALNRAVGQF